MPVTSVIVEIEKDAEETVLGKIAQVPRTSVFGMKDGQIVIVIDGESADEVEEAVRSLAALDRVVGVYPVYSGEA
jgi:nitrate reductase NapAB chaperone NapD